MDPEDNLSTPLVSPLDTTVLAFWRKIAYLTTRTRTNDGRWVGSHEVKKWNSFNMQSCIKCSASRTPKQCIVEDDQASCRPCRDAKMACDRKVQFLFDATRDDFFPTMDLFLDVYNTKPLDKTRSFQKTANKRRKATIPYSKTPKPRFVISRAPAISSSMLANADHRPTNGPDDSINPMIQEFHAVHQEIGHLREDLRQMEEKMKRIQENANERLRQMQEKTDQYIGALLQRIHRLEGELPRAPGTRNIYPSAYHNPPDVTMRSFTGTPRLP